MDSTTPRGDCYVAAFNLLLEIMDDPDSMDVCLVHGNVLEPSTGDRIDHAWVENQTTVLDYSNGVQTEMDKTKYYDMLNITETQSYSPMHAMRMNANDGHYGPWSDDTFV